MAVNGTEKSSQVPKRKDVKLNFAINLNNMTKCLLFTINLFPTSHDLWSAPLVCLCSYVADIANNIDPDQTDPMVIASMINSSLK